MNRTDLENMLDESYKAIEEKVEPLEQHKANFNMAQTMYHDLFDTWYVPARKVHLDLWENSKSLESAYNEDAYNHE